MFCIKNTILPSLLQKKKTIIMYCIIQIFLRTFVHLINLSENETYFICVGSRLYVSGLYFGFGHICRVVCLSVCGGRL